MCQTVYNLDEAQTVIGFVVKFLRETPSTLRGQLGALFLHAAARNPHMEAGAAVIRALCAAGANVAARDEAGGNQALHIAVLMDCFAAATMPAWPTMDKPWEARGLSSMLAGEAAPPHVQALLDAKAPVNRLNSAGYSPIHLAVASQTHPGSMRGLLKALLKAGGDACAPAASRLAFHPIHIAASQNGHPGAAAEAIRILVEAGESPSAPAGAEGIMPLHCVMGRSTGWFVT